MRDPIDGRTVYKSAQCADVDLASLIVFLLLVSCLPRLVLLKDSFGVLFEHPLRTWLDERILDQIRECESSPSRLGADVDAVLKHGLVRDGSITAVELLPLQFSK